MIPGFVKGKQVLAGHLLPASFLVQQTIRTRSCRYYAFNAVLFQVHGAYSYHATGVGSKQASVRTFQDFYRMYAAKINQVEVRIAPCIRKRKFIKINFYIPYTKGGA